MQLTTYLGLVDECLCNRVKRKSIDLLTDAITILASKEWEKSELASFAYPALEHVCTRYTVPLTNK